MAEVQFSSRALASLAAPDECLRPRNPAAADAVLAEVESLARLQAEFPAMGRRIEGTGLRYHVTRGYRYRVIYRLRGATVEFRDVIHPRRG